MLNDQPKAFVDAVKGYTTLQERVKVAETPEAVAAIAKEAGFIITADELRKLYEERELSDEKLESAAGAGFWYRWVYA
jgi:predicted ribosomally synthesized peptide with nif11-like leader